MKPNAHWFRLASPYNDTGTKNVGMVMASIRLVQADPLKSPLERRRVITKSEKTVFKFYCQVIQGFEIASSIQDKYLYMLGSDNSEPKELET